MYILNDNKTAFLANYDDTYAELKKGGNMKGLKIGGSLFFGHRFT